MGSRIEGNEIFYLWRITLLFNIMVIMNGVNSSSFIVTEDLYTNANLPFTLPVFYTNSMDRLISLECKTVTSNSGLTAQTVTLPVGSNQKVNVVFSGSLKISLPFEVSCSVGDQTEILTKSIVSNTEKVLGLCHLDQLYADPTTGKVEIRTAETQGDVNLNSCSCIDDGKSILNFDDKDTAKVNNGNCVGPVCECTLKCTYDTNRGNGFVSRKVKVLKPVLYITSSFEKLTLFKNTSTIAAFTVPPSTDTLECFANKVDVSGSTYLVEDVIKNSDFKDLVLEESGPGVYHVFPKDSNVPSGVYGIKCTSGTVSDSFVFEFDNSEASNIAGEIIDFDKYVSVPCSCDKTPGFCDHRCCCDKDCSDGQVLVYF